MRRSHFDLPQSLKHLGLISLLPLKRIKNLQWFKIEKGQYFFFAISIKLCNFGQISIKPVTLELEYVTFIIVRFYFQDTDQDHLVWKTFGNYAGKIPERES